jgi:hypothetical protein
MEQNTPAAVKAKQSLLKSMCTKKFKVFYFLKFKYILEFIDNQNES